MLYSHRYHLSHKNISQINKTDQTDCFATPEILLEAKFQAMALGYQCLLAHTILQFAYMKFYYW